MKLSVAIAHEKAAQSAFVVWRGFESSMRKAAEYGYDGVELALMQRSDIDKNELQRLLSRNHLEVSSISTGQVFSALGLFLTHSDTEVRKRAIEVLCGLVDLASDFGQLVNIGRVRGSVLPDQTPDQAEQLFIQSIEQILEYADKFNVNIIIEPVNRYEINFINNLDQGATLIRKIKANNIGLMPDVFHMNIEDDIIGNSLIRNKQFVKYIHLADSNRSAPGWGHLDFYEIFNALKTIGFMGWASVEILPNPDPDSAAMQAVTFLRNKMSACQL